MGGDSAMTVRQSKMPAAQTIKTTLAPNFSAKICSGRKTCAMTPDRCSPFDFALSDEFQSCGKSAASQIPMSRSPAQLSPAQPYHVIEASPIISIIQDLCREDSCKTCHRGFGWTSTQGSGHPGVVVYRPGG